MLSNPSLVLHIGCPKTATTSLQNNLFEDHPEILNIGQPFRRGPARTTFFAAADGSPGRNSNYAEELAAYTDANAKGRVVVFSEETIARHQARDSGTAKRIYDSIGPAKVLLTIRNQLGTIPSLYLQTGEQRYLSLDEWVDKKRTELELIFDYAWLADSFAAHFGRENIGVFVFEDMLADMDSFTRGVCRFAGVDEETGVKLMRQEPYNPRMSARELAFLRLKGKLLPEISLSQLLPSSVRQAIISLIRGGKPAKTTLCEKDVEMFSRRFSSGNKALAAEFGLSLSSHGYPV